MSRFILLLGSALFFTAAGVKAQNRLPFASTTVPEDARYEVVQSPMIARHTFKLDRQTGNVYLLVLSQNDELVWEIMQRLPHSQDGGQRSGAANYQIFLSGIAARFTFLLNMRTGATWQLVEDTETTALFWSPRR